MSKFYLISDTHFFHENIIQYCNRPFENVKQMNSYIINQWNNTITSQDVIMHLGDFCFGDSETIINTCNELNGYKILLKGNHDRKGNSFYIKAGFSEVYGDKFITRGNCILSHRPQYKIPFDIINIHGHIHNIDTSMIEDYTIDNHINVSSDVIGFTPIHYPELEPYFL